MTERTPPTRPAAHAGPLEPVYFTARPRKLDRLYVPSRRLLEPELRMQQPRPIAVNWRFDDGAYANLLQGYRSHSQDEKWDLFTDRDIYHAHRASTGNEIFVLPLYYRDIGYVANRFLVEQDPQRFRPTDERVVTELMIDVLGWAGVVAVGAERQL